MSIGSRLLLVAIPAVLSVGIFPKAPKATVLKDSVSGQESIASLLTRNLSDGEAIIWYLGHCGWAVKTRTRLLVLDYWEQNNAGGVRSLANGRINPEEIRSLDVFVFVTHAHGDHYDPVILEWADELPNISYIFGWDAGLDPGFVYMSEERDTRVIDSLEVSTVNHRFDNIPEVAYLLKVDGLTIYHSGDHASTAEIPNHTFAGNIDFFAGKQDRVDIAFIATFGRRGGAIVNNGDIYTIESLKPRVAFPMHHGGGEDLNQRFANEVGPRIGSTPVVAALQPGDRYFYSEGKILRAQ